MMIMRIILIKFLMKLEDLNLNRINKNMKAKHRIFLENIEDRRAAATGNCQSGWWGKQVQTSLQKPSEKKASEQA